MAYKKQKGGPKMYRKDGALPMKSPMKNYKNPQDYKVFNMGNEPTPMEMHGKHDGPKMEKTPTYMKSSGFKMKSGSPFQRNFGIGASPAKAAKPDYPDIDGDGNTTESMKQAAADKKSPMEMASPMKNLGIYPVDADGMIMGDQMSPDAAKEHVSKGGRIMKTGPDEVAANKADVADKIASGEIKQSDIDRYQEEDGPEIVKTTFDESNKDDKMMYFDEREITEETSDDTDPENYESDLSNYKKILGDDLYNKEIQRQDYINKYGSTEGMPEDLLAAGEEIKSKINEQTENTGGLSEYDARYDLDESTNQIGRIEGKDGGEPNNFEVPISKETRKFRNIELKPGDVTQAQEGGTEAAKEQARLDEIAEKERLAEETRVAEEKRVADEKAAEEKAVIDKENTAKLDDWVSNNPPPNPANFRKGTESRGYQNQLINYNVKKRSAKRDIRDGMETRNIK